MPGSSITKKSFNRLVRSGRKNSKIALRKSGKDKVFSHPHVVFSRPSRSNPTVYVKRHRTKSIRKKSNKKKVLRPNSY